MLAGLGFGWIWRAKPLLNFVYFQRFGMREKFCLISSRLLTHDLFSTFFGLYLRPFLTVCIEERKLLPYSCLKINWIFRFAFICLAHIISR